MKNLLALIVALFLVTPTFAKAPESVVRIYVFEDKDSFRDSYGSGALISSTQVLTNWHVVKDRRSGNRAVEVRFVDGLRSFAAVVQQSQLWDVALLKIHPTKLKPFSIGSRPAAGDKLTIHGLGYDYEYRALTGVRGDKEMHPTGLSHQPDLFEVTNVAARQGDSGGPVTDVDGNLVGILFGSNNSADGKYTHGTLIGRVQKVFGSKMKPSLLSPVDNGTDYIIK